WESAKEVRHLDGMGATVVAAVYDESTRGMYIAHVGDSRAYRLRRGRCELLTSDHRVAQEGPMTAYLRRALGVRSQVHVDVAVGPAEPGDVYLFCSDGLSRMKTDQEIATLLAGGNDPARATEQLIAAANTAGGKDNVAVVVVRLDHAARSRSTTDKP